MKEKTIRLTNKISKKLKHDKPVVKTQAKQEKLALEYKTLIAKRDQEVFKLRKKYGIKIEGDFPNDIFCESFKKMHT